MRFDRKNLVGKWQLKVTHLDGPMQGRTETKSISSFSVNRISRRRALGMFISAAAVASFAALGSTRPLFAEEEEDVAAIDGRVIAIGIPGASGVAPIGTFLPGAGRVHPAWPGARSHPHHDRQ